MGYATPAVLGVDEGHWWWRFVREDFHLKCQFSIGLSPLGTLAVQGFDEGHHGVGKNVTIML